MDLLDALTTPSPLSDNSSFFVTAANMPSGSTEIGGDTVGKIVAVIVVLGGFAALIVYILKTYNKPYDSKSTPSSTNVVSPSSSPPSGGPVNCAVTWGDWSSCSVLCGPGGQQTRSATIVTPPSNGGQGCPSLTQTRPCQPVPPPCDKVCCHDQGLQTTTPVPYHCSLCYSPAATPASYPSYCDICPMPNCSNVCSCNPNVTGATCQTPPSGTATFGSWIRSSLNRFGFV